MMIYGYSITGAKPNLMFYLFCVWLFMRVLYFQQKNRVPSWYKTLFVGGKKDFSITQIPHALQALCFFTYVN